jgi:hypothetical protein
MGYYVGSRTELGVTSKFGTGSDVGVAINSIVDMSVSGGETTEIDITANGDTGMKKFRRGGTTDGGTCTVGILETLPSDASLPGGITTFYQLFDKMRTEAERGVFVFTFKDDETNTETVTFKAFVSKIEYADMNPDGLVRINVDFRVCGAAS